MNINCKEANKDVDGKCLGYSHGCDDDEPVDQCKECEKCTVYGIE